MIVFYDMLTPPFMAYRHDIYLYIYIYTHTHTHTKLITHFIIYFSTTYLKWRKMPMSTRPGRLKPINY